MTLDEKNRRGSFGEKFKVSGARRIAKCVELLERSGQQSADESTKTVAFVRDEIGQLEGEAQLFGFKDLGRLFAVLAERLKGPVTKERIATIRQGLSAAGPLLQHWQPDGSGAQEVEGIVAALQGHLEQKRKEEGPVDGCRSRRIVFIDDSEITRDSIKLALEAEGYIVTVAANLVKFEEALKEFQPEMILTDINMPEIQGDEICRVLKGKCDTANIPVVLFSSLGDEELARMAERVGADGYVSKQHGVEKLVEQIDQLIVQILW